MPTLRVAAALLALGALAAAPSAALAVSTDGRGEGIQHIKNLPYPEHNAPDEANAGTDLEFATLTVDRRETGEARPADADPARKGLQRTFAFAGSYGDGLHVVDVTDPAASRIVATWDCGISQGDVQVFQRADLGGRWFATFAHDDGYAFHADSQCAQDLVARGFDPAATAGPARTSRTSRTRTRRRPCRSSRRARGRTTRRCTRPGATSTTRTPT